jgi:DNA invertase Pin-like site-specific DNA recombinase
MIKSEKITVSNKANQVPTANKTTALYCRLSSEDEQSGESMSIQNQRKILKEYADNNHFFNTRFFVDDGISGVTFQRDGLQEMLAEVEAGNVSTVIVKDLSRLGRDYLKTGELIEIVFPENNVRFIAISDNVDSSRGDEEFTGLRNWFNDFYARDTSKKIRAIKKNQAQNGKRVNGSYPYGYIPNPVDRNHLIPDPETSHVVQKVFEMYVAGERMCDIQKWLFVERHLTPNALRFQRTGHKTYGKAMEFPYAWSDKTINDMVARREYLGHTYTSKTHKVSYKVKKTVKHGHDDQLEFLNTHEPLVSEETFQIAQKRISQKNRPCKIDEIDIFSGILFCKDCGKRMYVQRGHRTLERKHAYVCGTYRNTAHLMQKCSTHYIRRSVLTELVLKDIQRVSAFITANKSGFLANAKSKHDKKVESSSVKSKQEYLRDKSRLVELDTIFRRLYEDQVFGKISETQFATMVTSYDEEREKLTMKIADAESVIKKSDEEKNNAITFVKIVEKYENITDLSYELLHELIDRIYIHEVDKENCTRDIEILYNYVGVVDGCDVSGERPMNETYFRQGHGKGACLVKSIVI